MSDVKTIEKKNGDNENTKNAELQLNEKRRLINSLDCARENSVSRYPSRHQVDPEIFSVQHALGLLAESVHGMTDLEECVEVLRNELDNRKSTRDNFRISQDTCKMLEESLMSLENKLLDAIADNGGLVHKIDMLENELMNARISLARLSRQRDELRQHLDACSLSGKKQRIALLSAEKEIAKLSERLQNN